MKKKKVLHYIGRALLLAARGVFWLAKGIAKIIYKILKTGFSTAKKQAIKSQQPKEKAMSAQLTELKPISGSLKQFEDNFLSSKSLIGIILGARGSGKSALGMRLLENAHAEGRPTAAMGFGQEVLPEWIDNVSSLSEVKNGSFLLVDEGGISFSSRNSASEANKLLSELLLISRHKDLSVLFISQNSSNLDVNALRQADYLLLRKPSLLQKDFERKIIQKIYDQYSDEFRRFSNRLGLTLVYAGNYIGFVENSLPGFWSSKVSKSLTSYKK